MREDCSEPVNQDCFIAEAEDACLRKLCELTAMQYGVNAFAGIKSDNAVECIVFDIGKPESGEQFGFPSQSFHYRGQMDVYSRSRKTVQQIQGRILLSMPIQTTQRTGVKMPKESNVEQFRIAPINSCISPVNTVEIPVGNLEDGKVVEVFTSTIFFDIIFTAGTRVSA